jgi:hypothetical protein
MSKIASIFFFVLMAGPGFGQQEHFALIRADNNQPFYVRIRQQTLSSSAQGHLILSQLHDSVYPIVVGFPRQQFPEQEFILAIDKDDPDLRLEDRDGKGWVLFDMGTQQEQLPMKDTTEKKTHLEGVKKDDAFSRLMADVVSDTAVMYNTYVVEAPARDSAAGAADSLALRKISASPGLSDSLALRKMDTSPGTPDSLALRKITFPPPSASDPSDPSARKMIPPPDSPATPPVLKAVAFTGTLDSAKKDPSGHFVDSAAGAPKAVRPAKSAHIEKIAEQKTATVLRLSYADRRKGRRTDTIDIQIPIDTVMPKTSLPDTVKTASGLPTTAVKAKLVVINSDCRNFASDDDVDKLRTKFQTLPADEAKIGAARKVFKLKCFTTNQLKTLSESFSAEEAKYRFLETAYPFVSDDDFRELSGLFTDPVYIAKFKTLVGTP